MRDLRSGKMRTHLTGAQPAVTGRLGGRVCAQMTMFFRPTQSEAVLQQFGDLAISKDGCNVGSWTPFPAAV